MVPWINNPVRRMSRLLMMHYLEHHMTWAVLLKKKNLQLQSHRALLVMVVLSSKPPQRFDHQALVPPRGSRNHQVHHCTRISNANTNKSNVNVFSHRKQNQATMTTMLLWRHLDHLHVPVFNRELIVTLILMMVTILVDSSQSGSLDCSHGFYPWTV